MMVQELEKRRDGKYAIVVSREVLLLVGINPEARVRIDTDGRRLIVSAEGAPATSPTKPPRGQPVRGFENAELRDPAVTVKLLDELTKKHHMQTFQFQRLHHFGKKSAPGTHRAYCVDLLQTTPPGRFRTKSNVEVAARLRVCLGALRSGCTWDEAIELARDAFP